jgi:hypothetical protein
MNRRWLAICAAILAIALFGTGIALSDEKAGGGFKDKASKLESTFLERLAAELGVSKDKLAAAMKSAGVKSIDDAVKAGILTAEQAAELKERVAAGKLDFGLGHGFGWGHLKDKNGGPGGKDFKHGRWSALGTLMSDAKARASIGAAIAKTLGMSTDELRAALKADGKDIEDLMQAKGVTEEKFGAAVAAAAKPHLDRLLKAGTVERQDAEELLAQMAKGAWVGKLAHLSEITGG